MVNVQMSVELAEKLNALAYARKTNRTALVREAVEALVAKSERKKA